MKRLFFLFGIFFIGLLLIAILYQNILLYFISNSIYGLPSFGKWLLVVTSMGIVVNGFGLAYYYHKGYNQPLLLGALLALLEICQGIILYLIVNNNAFAQLGSYFLFITGFKLIAGLLYGFSLVLSKTRKVIYLKIMGILILIIVGIALSIFSLVLMYPALEKNETIEFISLGLSFAGLLTPVPLALLFYHESKWSKKNDEIKANPDLYYALAGLAVVLLLIFAGKIGTQAYWKTHITPLSRKLAVPFEKRVYTNKNGDKLNYRLLTPYKITPSMAYPLVVSLHGGAGWGTDNFKQIEGSLFARMFSKIENRKKYPAYIHVPQAPPGSSWGNLPNHTTIDSLVFESINALEKEFKIDKKRIYVVGHSLGGYGAWHFIETAPDLFAAAIPVAGEGNLLKASALVNTHIWAFHGANDKNVPVSGSRDMIAAIKKEGGHPKYHESPNAGHGWGIIDEEPGLLDWLFEQTK